jgi:hypothetical protein
VEEAEDVYVVGEGGVVVSVEGCEDRGVRGGCEGGWGLLHVMLKRGLRDCADEVG